MQNGAQFVVHGNQYPMAYEGPIDTILKEKDFTLEMLLDEDELMVEAKKGREDLLQLSVLTDRKVY